MIRNMDNFRKKFDKNIVEYDIWNYDGIYNKIYMGIDKIYDAIIELIISYIKKQKIRLYYNGNYGIIGEYISIFIFDESNKYGGRYECFINVNKDKGTHYGEFRNTCGEIYFKSKNKKNRVYEYGFIEGIGNTMDYDNDYFSDGEEHEEEFLMNIEIFCKEYHSEHKEGDWKTQIGTGYEIENGIGKYVDEWNNNEYDLDGYYFVSIYNVTNCVIVLTEYEYECIKRELTYIQDILFEKNDLFIFNM